MRQIVIALLLGGIFGGLMRSLGYTIYMWESYVIIGWWPILIILLLVARDIRRLQ